MIAEAGTERPLLNQDDSDGEDRASDRYDLVALAACRTSHAGRDSESFSPASNTLSFAGSRPTKGEADLWPDRSHLARSAVPGFDQERQQVSCAAIWPRISGRSLSQITRLIRCYRQSGAVKPAAPRSPPSTSGAATTSGRASSCSPRSTPPTKGSRGRRCGTFSSVRIQGPARPSTKDWPPSRPPTSTTCGAREPIDEQHVHHTKTRARGVSIGERRKPDSRGQPGYLRVDTVHQGDTETQRGLYHINAVDTVTQVGRWWAVPKPSPKPTYSRFSRP